MTISFIDKVGCACGKVRYNANEELQVTVACHYRYCQFRSESASGKLVYFK